MGLLGYRTSLGCKVPSLGEFFARCLSDGLSIYGQIICASRQTRDLQFVPVEVVENGSQLQGGSGFLIDWHRESIINAIEGAVVGSTFTFTIRNKSAGANTITLVAGTGVTLNSGDTVTVVQNAQKSFKIIVTGLGASAAVTIYSDALTF